MYFCPDGDGGGGGGASVCVARLCTFSAVQCNILYSLARRAQAIEAGATFLSSWCATRVYIYVRVNEPRARPRRRQKSRPRHVRASACILSSFYIRLLLLDSLHSKFLFLFLSRRLSPRCCIFPSLIYNVLSLALSVTRQLIPRTRALLIFFLLLQASAFSNFLSFFLLSVCIIFMDTYFPTFAYLQSGLMLLCINGLCFRYTCRER